MGGDAEMAEVTRADAMAAQRCVWGDGRPWPKDRDVRDEPVCGAPVGEGDCYCGEHRRRLSTPVRAGVDRVLGDERVRGNAFLPRLG